MLSAAVLHCLPFTGLCNCAICSGICILKTARTHSCKPHAVCADCFLQLHAVCCSPALPALHRAVQLRILHLENCAHTFLQAARCCARMQHACARNHARSFCQLSACCTSALMRTRTHSRMHATKPACCTRILMHCAQHTELGRCECVQFPACRTHRLLSVYYSVAQRV